MSGVFGEGNPLFGDDPAERAAAEGGLLTEADAVEIWIARWLRIRRKDLVVRYGCDPRRLYEVWWGDRFPASREKAERLFRDRYPGLVDRTAFGYRKIPTALAAVTPKSSAPGRQLDLFSSIPVREPC